MLYSILSFSVKTLQIVSVIGEGITVQDVLVKVVCTKETNTKPSK